MQIKTLIPGTFLLQRLSSFDTKEGLFTSISKAFPHQGIVIKAHLHCTFILINISSLFG